MLARCSLIARLITEHARYRMALEAIAQRTSSYDATEARAVATLALHGRRDGT